jgi:hypothetical protein
MLLNEKQAKAQSVIQLLIVISLWSYIIYRAAFIPITEDEAHSYLLVKTNNWRQMAGTANTHWLNSLFMKIFLLLPGTDEVWKLRMLSIISWIPYAFAVMRLTAKLRHQWIGWIFFLTAIGNPFVIFYFSIGRGYAGACAFIMLSLWKALELTETQELKPKDWVPVFLFASLAALANFSAFYFFLALTATYFLLLLQQSNLKRLFNREASGLIILLAGTAFFSVGSLLIMRHFNTLYFGGTHDLVHSIFGSLLKSFSYFDGSFAEYQLKGAGYFLSEDLHVTFRALAWMLFILMLLAFTSVTYSSYKLRHFTKAGIALMICVFIVLLNVVFHLAFNTPYLLERTALVIFPPLIVGLCYALDRERGTGRKRKLAAIILSCIWTVFISANFYRSASLKTFREWPVQSDTKAALNYLQSQNAGKVGMSVWHHDVLVNYYKHAYPGKFRFNYVVLPEKSTPVFSQQPFSDCDYLLMTPPYYNGNLLQQWKLIRTFPESGTLLYKRG